MSININKSQQNNLSFLDSTGDNVVEFTLVKSVLEQYGALFQENLSKYGNKAQVVGSGKLLSNIIPEIEKTATAETLRIRMLDYYDYPNEGVKGVTSSKNAPNSPYQYKNYGVPDSMKKSLKDYIQSGKAKINVVRKDKALGIGLEKKGVRMSARKSLIDTQVATMGFLIKKFGIKSTHYFTDAFKETFKDFEVTMTEALGKDIVVTLDRINRVKLK